MIEQQKFKVADYAIFYLLINIIIPVGIYQMCDLASLKIFEVVEHVLRISYNIVNKSFRVHI